MASRLTGRRKVLVAAVVVAVAGAGVFAVVRMRRDDGPKLPKELSVEALNAVADDPGAVRERIEAAFARADLTEEQREQLRHNMREVFEAQMDKRLDEYFTADAATRAAVLDRHLDDLQARMREWQRDGGGPLWGRGRGGRGPGAGLGGGSGGAGPGAADGSEGRGGDAAGAGPGPGADGRRPDGDGRRGPDRWRGGPPTRQERKERSESRSADARARRMAYFTALRQRAEERGIELPFPGRLRGGPR